MNKFKYVDTNKETISRESFKNIDEAVFFCVDLLNSHHKSWLEIVNKLEDRRLKDHCILRTYLQILCDRLEIYGMKISHEMILEEAEKLVAKNWEQCKAKVLKDQEEKEKAIEDLLRSADSNNDKNAPL